MRTRFVLAYALALALSFVFVVPNVIADSGPVSHHMFDRFSPPAPPWEASPFRGTNQMLPSSSFPFSDPASRDSFFQKAPLIGPPSSIVSKTIAPFLDFQAEQWGESVSVGASTASSDDFGYTLNENVPFQWIDATSGTRLNLEGNDEVLAVQIGFSFPFYEQNWDQVFVSTNGLLMFGGAYRYAWAGYIPSINPPNNLIAPLWNDWTVGGSYNSGGIYVRRGGSAPNRYIVIEWYQVTPCCVYNSTDRQTFEVILYENGDIRFQYQELTVQYATVGIEDSTGTSGILYSGIPVVNTALLFSRPSPRARVKVWLPEQGAFGHAGEVVTYTLTVRNTGEIGQDVYDLDITSRWPVTAQIETGPLTDTDGDGAPDTGPLAQGEDASIIVKVQVPKDARVGDYDVAHLAWRSSLDTHQVTTVTLRTAVPASFAQAFVDRVEHSGIYLVKSQGRRAQQVSSKCCGQTAVAEISDGRFIYVWRESWSEGQRYGEDIWYQILDHLGRPISSPQRLTDSRTFEGQYVYNFVPTIAVLPSGEIGLAWRRTEYKSISQWRRNVWIAILDKDGRLKTMSNLSNISTWYFWNDPQTVSVFSPRIATAQNGRFVVAWVKEITRTSDWKFKHNVFYAVVDTSGNLVKSPTPLTNGQLGGTRYDNPALVGYGGRWVLIAYRSSDKGLVYQVLNSAGNVVRNETPLGVDGWNIDGVRLPNGHTALAWTGTGPRNIGEGQWRGEYYNNETLSGTPVLVRTDDTIDFQWDLGSPAPEINVDNFSVRWTGTITIPEGMEDTYTFYMGSDDGSRLWIDGRLVLDRWDTCCTTWSVPVYLTAGPHRVRMEMHEIYGAAWARLYWIKGQGPVIYYTLLDGSFSPVLDTPRTLSADASVSGNDSVSVTHDKNNRIILTWMAYPRDPVRRLWRSDFQIHLYYALLDAQGRVITPPMIFKHAKRDSGGYYYLITNGQGNGNTTYSWEPPSVTDLYLRFADEKIHGRVEERVGIGIEYGNNGGKVATGVRVTLNLPDGLSYLSDTSGVSPHMEGNAVTWDLPALGFLDQKTFTIWLRVAQSPPQREMAVHASIAAQQEDANTSDNEATGTVVAWGQVQNMDVVTQYGGFISSVVTYNGYVVAGIGPRLVVLRVNKDGQWETIGETTLLSDFVSDVFVDDSRAYISMQSRGMAIVDLSHPQQPKVLSHLETPGFTYQVVVSGTVAYLADSSALRVVDVSDPQNPHIIGEYRQEGKYAWSVAVHGNYAYAIFSGDLFVLDVSDPTTPKFVTSINFPEDALNITVYADIAYVNVRDVRVLSLQDPAHPTEVEFLDIPGSASSLKAINGYLYITDAEQGLHIYRLLRPEHPIWVGTLPLPGRAVDVTAAGDRAYVAGGQWGIYLVDISSPSIPFLLSIYDPPSVAWGMDEGDGLMIVAAGEAGVRILRRSGLADLAWLSTYKTKGTAYDVAYRDKRLYVANGREGLLILDVSDPAHPLPLGALDLGGTSETVIVRGNYAYVVSGNVYLGNSRWDRGGLYIVDISDPTSPKIVGVWQDADISTAKLQGSYLFAVSPWWGSSGGLYIIDVSNPSSPSLVAHVSPNDVGAPSGRLHFADVDVRGRYAYLAGGGGLWVLDISTLSAPQQVGHFESYWGEAVVVWRDWALVSEALGGLLVLDVSDPTHPQLAAEYPVPGWMFDVIPHDNFLYAANAYGGLAVLRLIRTHEARTVGVDGGTLAFDNNRLQLTLPANVFTMTVELDYSRLWMDQNPYPLRGIGFTFDLRTLAHDTGLPIAFPFPAGEQYQMQLTYDATVPWPVLENTLAFYYWNGSEWVREPTSAVDVTTHTVRATPNHFSLWAVLGETRATYIPLMQRAYPD